MASLRFSSFLLDPRNRLLRRDGATVDLNARYLDALVLLASEPGELISKDRFMDEVWRGVPVTDEALTQCIRTLRRQLGDDAAQPRFIETVPKHGYRFIAPVERVDAETPSAATEASAFPEKPAQHSWRDTLFSGGMGALGGGFAGLTGGLLYGLIGVSAPAEPGMGATSVIAVLVSITTLVGFMGGAGVAFGIALARKGRPGWWAILGGAAGGLIVGAVIKILGQDAFNLLVGQSPGAVTGGPEGALLGGAVGLGAWLSTRSGTAPSLRRSAITASVAGCLAGILITLLGGRLMAGSLDVLAQQFTGSRLQLDQISRIVGEPAFGPISQTVTGALEGLLFSACVVGAMTLTRRSR